MEPTDKSFVIRQFLAKTKEKAKAYLDGFAKPDASFAFLSDADELESRPIDPRLPRVAHVLVALLVLGLLWASLSQVDMVVVARGKVIVPSSNLVVQPLETSVINAIHVRIGQVVKKGAELVTLDPTFVTADVAQAKTKMASLDSQIRRLESEMRNERFSPQEGNSEDALQSDVATEKRANYESRLIQLNETIGRLSASLETNEKETQALQSRVNSLAEIESMNERLAEQRFQSKLKLLESRERKQEVERDLQIAKLRRTEIRRDLAAAVAERNAFVREWRQKGLEEKVSAKRERDALSSVVEKADRRASLITLTAPRDAVVLEIAKRSIGSVVKEAEPLITLVPLDEVLEAEVQVESDDVGYIKLGDRSRIKIDSYPFQKYGLLEGQLTTVTQDAFTREPSQRMAGQRGDVYYLARVSFNPDSLVEWRKKKQLLPGMTLTTEIVVGQRSVISYFLYPMIRALDESMREP